jgi:hypothetical protein
MAEATKKQLDDAHDMGVRDKETGGSKNPPHKTSIFSQDLHRKEQINDAYRHGHDAAKTKK